MEGMRWEILHSKNLAGKLKHMIGTKTYRDDHASLRGHTSALKMFSIDKIHWNLVHLFCKLHKSYRSQGGGRMARWGPFPFLKSRKVDSSSRDYGVKWQHLKIVRPERDSCILIYTYLIVIFKRKKKEKKKEEAKAARFK